MKIESVKELPIWGAKLIHFGTFDDQRGYFCEPYRESQLQAVIPGFRCVQVNESLSKAEVIRGLHVQTDPPMGKLVRVLTGEMHDLILDLRRESPTFGKAIRVLIGEDTWIWVPPGCAHGNWFPRHAKIEYLCTAEYNQAGESAVNVFSPEIVWLTERHLPYFGAIRSQKDADAPTLTEWLEAHK